MWRGPGLCPLFFGGYRPSAVEFFEFRLEIFDLYFEILDLHQQPRIGVVLSFDSDLPLEKLETIIMKFKLLLDVLLAGGCLVIRTVGVVDFVVSTGGCI